MNAEQTAVHFVRTLNGANRRAAQARRARRAKINRARRTTKEAAISFLGIGLAMLAGGALTLAWAFDALPL